MGGCLCKLVFHSDSMVSNHGYSVYYMGSGVLPCCW